MTKDQTTFCPKDNYFRTPTEDLKEPIAEVDTTRENKDDVSYKDQYFHIRDETVEN